MGLKQPCGTWNLVLAKLTKLVSVNIHIYYCCYIYELVIMLTAFSAFSKFKQSCELWNFVFD